MSERSKVSLGRRICMGVFLLDNDCQVLLAWRPFGSLPPAVFKLAVRQ